MACWYIIQPPPAPEQMPSHRATTTGALAAGVDSAGNAYAGAIRGVLAHIETQNLTSNTAIQYQYLNSYIDLTSG
jgi:hypothetical protein